MDQITAIRHIYNDPNGMITHTNEWIEAGLWGAVCRVLADESKTWTVDELDALLNEANDN